MGYVALVRMTLRVLDLGIWLTLCLRRVFPRLERTTATSNTGPQV